MLSAIRIRLEAPVASFRYPHFLIGRQPTFPMPPPATIYGLLSAALGDYPDPRLIRFAYQFNCEKDTIDDLETIWFVSKTTTTRGKNALSNLEAQSNILPRELVVNPQLTLYLTCDNDQEFNRIYKAFICPSYILTLGRSQELVSVRDVEVIDMNPCKIGRLEPGLYPKKFWEFVPFGNLIHMPKFINPKDRRQILWEWYMAMDIPTVFSVTTEGCWTMDEMNADKPPCMIYLHNFN